VGVGGGKGGILDRLGVGSWVFGLITKGYGSSISDRFR
jgi:hypothetical protein